MERGSNKRPLCINWSIENKQCRFNYETKHFINHTDLIPHCDGQKTNAECCWYQAYRNIWRDFP